MSGQAPGNFFHYALEIAYDGSCFSGWQSQPDGGGVQDAIETAIAKLGERTRVDGAGRTDAGVHARAQVASVRLSKNWAPRRLALAINSSLPAAVSVMRASSAPQAFHARKSAVSREYRYFIWNSPTCYPHLRPYVLWKPGGKYDWARAASAAKRMEGVHDFRAFCRAGDCPEFTLRDVARSSITKRGPLIIFRVEANAFLTNMVRVMMGNLLEISRGRRDELWLANLLSGNEGRTSSGDTLPPSGLFLWRVRYAEKLSWRQ
jgi:tRNA pseudouridine38-40 synthase